MKLATPCLYKYVIIFAVGLFSIHIARYRYVERRANKMRARSTSVGEVILHQSDTWNNECLSGKVWLKDPIELIKQTRRLSIEVINRVQI